MPNAVDIIRRFQMCLNAHDLTAIDRYVAPNFVSHVEGIPPDRALWKQTLMEEIRAYQEIFCSIDEVYEEGDRVYLQMTDEYRQISPFYGQMSDSRKCRMTSVCSYRVVNNLITDVYPTTLIKYTEFE